MVKLIVELPEATHDLLRQRAYRELRRPQMEARWLLEHALTFNTTFPDVSAPAPLASPAGADTSTSSTRSAT